MLSGIGFPELILIFVIGLLILGPERLPRVASQIGRWIGRARRTANQLRFQLEREIALADIDKKTPKNPPEDREPKTGSADESKAGTSAGESGGDRASGPDAAAGGSDAASPDAGRADSDSARGPSAGADGRQAGAAPAGESNPDQADGDTIQKP